MWGDPVVMNRFFFQRCGASFGVIVLFFTQVDIFLRILCIMEAHALPLSVITTMNRFHTRSRQNKIVT